MATELVPTPKNNLSLYEIEDNLAALANTFEVVGEDEVKQILLEEIGRALWQAKEKRDAVVAFLRHCEAQQNFADQEIERIRKETGPHCQIPGGDRATRYQHHRPICGSGPSWRKTPGGKRLEPSDTEKPGFGSHHG